MSPHHLSAHIPPSQRAALGQKDAAKYIGVCPGTLRNHLRTGRLTDVKVGRRRLYLVSDLNALLGPAVQ